MRNAVEQLIREEVGQGASLQELVKLHGDASCRTYYRARLAGGASYIVMQMPKGRTSASEEVTNFKGVHRELPFINIARFLRSRGLPVPAVHAYREEERLILLEDLGEDLLAGRVAGAPAREQLAWYGRAIELLLELQRATAGAGGSECVAFARSFDATLLDWEFDHFAEYGIEARLGRPLGDADRALFLEQTRRISAEIQRVPYGFTHRDFQSRNLIVHGDALAMIDFQDALLGPAVYDLVALLRDSYVTLDDPAVESLMQRYAKGAGRPEAAIRREFDLVTVQRKLKDAGRFVYIDRVKGNPNFLPYIPTSLGYVRQALARLPDCWELAKLLAAHVPEWQ